jgi:hypothetical protein
MERSSKRGKIPQQDWPSIIKRYEAGETLASIARTYDCSPPAISYILSRSRTRDLSAEGMDRKTTDAGGPGAVNADPTAIPVESTTGSGSKTGEAAKAIPAVGASDPVEALPFQTAPIRSGPDSNGAAINSGESSGIVITEAPQRNSDHNAGNLSHSTAAHNQDFSGELQPVEPRRTLHLSLSHNGDQRAEPTRHHGREAAVASDSAARQTRKPDSPDPQFVRGNPPPYPLPNGSSAGSAVEPEKSREVANFIDRALRERVDGDIRAFLAAFDAALADDTIESRAGLREATDRLLRAGARTRIELERLEARVPLPARAASGHLAPSVWRQR